MNLDKLHKVMKGDMTIDQAREGMTDDYEIGHVSHRKDGDYRKVAPGKWVPVKAGGTPQETAGTLAARGYVKEINSKTNNTEKRDKLLTKKFTELFRTKGPSSFEAMGELYSRVKKAKPHTDEWYIAMNNYDMASKLYHGVIGGDNVDYYNKQIENLRMRPNYGQDPQETKIRESIKSIAEGEKKPDSQGNKNVLTSADDVNWDIIEQVQKEAYKANETHGTLEMMGKYDITQIQKFANANVDTDFDNVDGIKGYLKKKAGQPGGVDLDVAAKELAKFNNWYNARAIWRNYENKELAVDDTGHFYVPESARPKAEGEERLTRDTKIRLSRIKQEVTEDKTYNVGETSQRKDGLYKKVAPGKWEPVKGGGSAGAPAGGTIPGGKAEAPALEPIKEPSMEEVLEAKIKNLSSSKKTLTGGAYETISDWAEAPGGQWEAQGYTIEPFTPGRYFLMKGRNKVGEASSPEQLKKQAKRYTDNAQHKHDDRIPGAIMDMIIDIVFPSGIDRLDPEKLRSAKGTINLFADTTQIAKKIKRNVEDNPLEGKFETLTQKYNPTQEETQRVVSAINNDSARWSDLFIDYVLALKEKKNKQET